MLTDEEVRALVRARAQRWVERKLRRRQRYERRMRRADPRWGRAHLAKALLPFLTLSTRDWFALALA